MPKHTKKERAKTKQSKKKKAESAALRRATTRMADRFGLKPVPTAQTPGEVAVDRNLRVHGKARPSFTKGKIDRTSGERFRRLVGTGNIDVANEIAKTARERTERRKRKKPKKTPKKKSK